MKYSVVISQRAEHDLTDVCDYISNESPYLAERLLEELLQSVESLSEFPLKHAIILKMGSIDIRQFVFKKAFRILYCVKGTQVRILHCYRCERDFLSLLLNDDA